MMQGWQEGRWRTKIAHKGPLELAAVEMIKRKKFKRIGFEASRISYQAYERLKGTLPLGASLKPIGPIIEKMRMIKSDDEIARIRRSVLTNSEAFEKTIGSIRP